MNYYIQGDAARADKIKAVFEKLGYEPYCWTFETEFYFTVDCTKTVQILSSSSKLINIIKTHPDYKKLELPVEPKFKVGDWVACDADSFTLSIKNVRDGNYYFHQGESLPIKYIDEHYHLWSMADAKDGDVITNGKLIVIFNKLEEPVYRQHIIAYVGLDLCGRLQITRDTWRLGVDKAMPATKEQRDLLFAKMKEAGYQWDIDKKELRKIQPHYDIANFKPYQKVLIRFGNNDTWRADFFSHIKEDRGRYFVGIGYANKQCIPFEGNEHLLGTTDMCDEMYINW